MKLNWYRRDQQGVVEALKRGTRSTMATTMSCGPLDELIALHDELGVFDALGEVECQRQRAPNKRCQEPIIDFRRVFR